MDLLTKLAEDPGFLDHALGFPKQAAEPWSVLRTGLTHGAFSAIPGSVLGGAIGYATAPKDYTQGQRLSRAGKGALTGGAVTGLLGGGASGAMQREHVDMFNEMKGIVNQLGTGTEQLNKFPNTWIG